jgi:Domain of unknown function (DUF4326)
MHRIQLGKEKGWRMPEGAVYVGRMGGKRRATSPPVGTLNYWASPYPMSVYGRGNAIALFRRDVAALTDAEREAWLAPLRQATALVCFCPLDQPCHADVLMEYLTRSAPAMED